MAASEATSLPGILFAALGLYFLQKALRPGAKQSWSWGRGGGSVPVSRWGYASWAATFLAIALVISHAPEPPVASIALFMVFFLTTLVVGFLDARRYNRAQRLSERRRSQGA